MYEIVKKAKIAPDIFRFEVSARLIADKFKAGQFIVLRPFEDSERLPLTIMRADRKAVQEECVLSRARVEEDSGRSISGVMHSISYRLTGESTRTTA